MSPQDQLLISKLVTYLYVLPLLVSLGASIILLNKTPDKWKEMDRYISWVYRVGCPFYNWYTAIVFIGSLISVSWTWFIVNPFRDRVKEVEYLPCWQLLPTIIWYPPERSISILLPIYFGITFYLRD